MVINPHHLYSKGERGRIKGDKLKWQSLLWILRNWQLMQENILPVAIVYLKRIQKVIINYNLNSFASFLFIIANKYPSKADGLYCSNLKCMEFYKNRSTKAHKLPSKGIQYPHEHPIRNTFWDSLNCRNVYSTAVQVQVTDIQNYILNVNEKNLKILVKI